MLGNSYCQGGLKNSLWKINSAEYRQELESTNAYPITVWTPAVISSSVILGVALNISQHGIQLETDRKIRVEKILLMFFDYQSNYIAAKGRVVYTLQDGPDKFKTGICLEGPRRENLKFIKKLIRSYHYRRNVPIFVA